jgi:hypothetical protein
VSPSYAPTVFASEPDAKAMKADKKALAEAMAAASAAGLRQAIAQTPGATETSPSPGVVVRSYGEERSLIPGFKTVTLRDVISIQRAGAAKRCKVLHRSEEETQMKHVGLPRHQIEIILPAAAV